MKLIASISFFNFVAISNLKQLMMPKSSFPRHTCILVCLTFTMAAYYLLSNQACQEFMTKQQQQQMLWQRQQQKQFKESYEQQLQWQQQLQEQFIEYFEARFSRKIDVENQPTEISSNERQEGTEIESYETKLYNSFKPLMTAEEVRQYIELFEVFHNVTEEWNIPYFIDSGTLIGAIRHRGFIPWDDDVDVQINTNDKEKLIAAFKSRAPKYRHYAWTDEGKPATVVNMKLFPADGKIISSHQFPAGCQWKWPFIDIFLYKVDSTQIFLATSRIYAYPKDVFFPHKLVRFEDLLVYAPRHPEVILNLEYNLSECVSPRYNHREEVYFPYGQDMKVPCTELQRLPALNSYKFYDLKQTVS